MRFTLAFLLEGNGSASTLVGPVQTSRAFDVLLDTQPQAERTAKFAAALRLVHASQFLDSQLIVCQSPPASDG